MQIGTRPYYKVIFVQVINDVVLDETLQRTGKNVDFIFHHQMSFPIMKVNEDVTTITIATLAYDYPNDKLIQDLTPYGTVLHIEHCKNSYKCVYRNAFNGRRIITIRRNQKPIPVYLIVKRYKVQIFTNQYVVLAVVAGNRRHHSVIFRNRRRCSIDSRIIYKLKKSLSCDIRNLIFHIYDVHYLFQT